MQSMTCPWSLVPGVPRSDEAILPPAWCHFTLSPGPPFVPGWPGTPCKKKLHQFLPWQGGAPCTCALPPTLSAGAEQKAQPWHHQLDYAQPPVHVGEGGEQRRLWSMRREAQYVFTGTRGNIHAHTHTWYVSREPEWGLPWAPRGCVPPLR